MGGVHNRGIFNLLIMFTSTIHALEIITDDVVESIAEG